MKREKWNDFCFLQGERRLKSKVPARNNFVRKKKLKLVNLLREKASNTRKVQSHKMDSDDDTFDNVDSGNVSSGDDDFPMEVDMNSKERQPESEEYPYEVLTTEEIVQHMVDCIKEVNTVIEVNFGAKKNKQKQKLSIDFD